MISRVRDAAASRATPADVGPRRPRLRSESCSTDCSARGAGSSAPVVMLWCGSGRWRYLGGDLLCLACEGERQEAGDGVQARSQRELDLFVSRAAAAAAEIADVQAAKVVFCVDPHGGSLVLAICAVGPPAWRGLKVQVPRAGP